MKNSFLRSKTGFTLPELVIAITISVMIMSGIFVFLTTLQDEIVISKQSTRVHTSLTDFSSTMQNLSKLYESGSIIVDGTWAYNVWLFTRGDGTEGALIWVVEEQSGSIVTLDPVWDKGVYGQKMIAWQKLTTLQISSILASTGSVYDIQFSGEGIFPDLTVTDFLITPYNSGTLLEYTIDIETPFYKKLKGKSRADINPHVATFSIVLDF